MAELPEDNPENRAKLTIAIDADYDFETGTFTPKRTVNLFSAGSAIIYLGDIEPSLDDNSEIYYFTKKTYDASIEIAFRPQIDDEEDDEKSGNQEGEEE